MHEISEKKLDEFLWKEDVNFDGHTKNSLNAHKMYININDSYTSNKSAI